MSQTSKPFSRLMKASFKPLFADKIFSITVPIKVRCSLETNAFHNMSRNISGVFGSPEAALGARPSFKGICSPFSRITVWLAESLLAASQTLRGLCYHQPQNPGWLEIHLWVLP